MEENQPNNKQDSIGNSLDAEWNQVKGLIPGLEEETKPESKEDTSDPEPEGKNQTEEEDADTGNDESDGDDSEKKSEPEEKPKPESKKRPERYIPIKQYVEEKKQFQKEKQELESKIAELSSITNKDASSKDKNQLVKQYAEKHGLDADSISELVDLVTGFVAPKDNPNKAEQEKNAEIIAKAEEVLAEKRFEQEYKESAVPQLKELFPDITEQQLAEIKEEIAKAATTEEYISQPLDYIVFKERNSLSKLIESSQPRKGLESSRPGQANATISPDDYGIGKGKVSFERLNDLSESERNKVVDKMSLNTFDQYLRYVESNQNLNIKRASK